jgi:hypothetical protein
VVRPTDAARVNNLGRGSALKSLLLSQLGPSAKIGHAAGGCGNGSAGSAPAETE